MNFNDLISSEFSSASMEITFGRIEKRIAQSFGIHETEETIQDPENVVLASSGLDKKDEYVDPWVSFRGIFSL